MSTAVAVRSLPERALELLRRVGNPFRNYFARNPDDEVCARYHVAELFARERDQLHGVVDLYRYDPTTHSEVVPVLGNKGAGKTHLLHSIKHGGDGAWQLLVTALAALSPAERLDVFPAPGFGRWARKLGLGTTQAQERVQWLLDSLDAKRAAQRDPSVHRLSQLIQRLQEAGLEPEKACEVVCQYVEKSAGH